MSRRFHDCTKGGKTEKITIDDGQGGQITTAMQLCQLKRNNAFYAVIIIPIVVFVIIVAGCLFVLRERLGLVKNKPTFASIPPIKDTSMI